MKEHRVALIFDHPQSWANRNELRFGVYVGTTADDAASAREADSECEKK